MKSVVGSSRIRIEEGDALAGREVGDYLKSCVCTGNKGLLVPRLSLLRVALQGGDGDNGEED